MAVPYPPFKAIGVADGVASGATQWKSMLRLTPKGLGIGTVVRAQASQWSSVPKKGASVPRLN